MSVEKSLSPRQQKAVFALLEGATDKQTANRVGVSLRTIERWKVNPDFRMAFDKTRQLAFENGIAKLAPMVDMAVEQLRDLLVGKTQATHAHLRTIELVLREARNSEEASIRAEIEQLKQAILREGR